MTDRDSRAQAQAQWNATPCGSVAGDPTTLTYFVDVESARRRSQPWQESYFRFDEFVGKKVLEIGCGHGTDLVRFARARALCTAVDITDAHLALTARNFTLRGLSVDLHKADATKLPFEDGTFDCVYSFGVVHHIPEIENVLREARRVLRPGGKLMIAVYHRWSALHLTYLLFNRGILHGELLRFGYAGVLANIEVGARASGATPYVRLYSRAGLSRLLRRHFVVEDVSVHQIELAHFSPGILRRAVGPFLSRLEADLGWYVAAIATKP